MKSPHRARIGVGKGWQVVQRSTRLVLPLLCWLASLSVPAVGADFYVATNGNDKWSGSLASPNPANTDGPFATLERARDALRRAKAEGKLVAGGAVWIRGGAYSRERSFELTATESGTPQAPVVYRAYSNETPRLLGGRIVRGRSRTTQSRRVSWRKPATTWCRWTFANKASRILAVCSRAGLAGQRDQRIWSYSSMANL